jgi:hypothetical protein
MNTPAHIPESSSLAELSERLTGRPSSIEPAAAKHHRKLVVMARLAAGQLMATRRGEELRTAVAELCEAVRVRQTLSDADAAVHRDAAYAMAGISG